MPAKDATRPLLAPSTDSSPEESRPTSVDPVRVLSLRDVVHLARAARQGASPRKAGAGGLPPKAFVAQSPFDRPWDGRRETWYDYLSPDYHYWKRLVWVALPLRFAFITAGTIGLGVAFKLTTDVNSHAQGLGAPVSAFSLLVSLVLTFRHSVAYQRFWDAKNAVGLVLACARNVAYAFASSPLEHRRQVAATVSAIVDCAWRSLSEDWPTDAALFERSPPGPWRAAALSALPPGLADRLAKSPLSMVAIACQDLCTSPAMKALDASVQGATIFELQTLTHAAAAVQTLSACPVPPLYTVLLHIMIVAFTLSLSIVTALTLTAWQSWVAWALVGSTVALIYVNLYAFYVAAHELAKPFRGKLQVPLRMYEACLLHDVYATLRPLTDEDVRSDLAGHPAERLEALGP